MASFQSVGKRLPRIGSEGKVTGRSIYINDLKLPGMLHGKILYSQFPHAKVVEIDITKAKSLKGVRAVLTGKNTPAIRMGLLRDTTPLKREKVRCYRDEVAAVAAASPEVAEEALHLIKVEYEPLPAIFDPKDALAPGAPLLYEERGTNLISLPTDLDCGDVEEGRGYSRWIAEDRFEATWVTHCCLGTNGCIAAFDPNGNLVLYTNTQIPNLAQKSFRDALSATGLRGRRVRVIKPLIGGAFGSKLEPHAHEYIAILLSHATGKPVKIVFTREEEFIATSPRQPAIIHIAQGCNGEGKLTFRDVRILMDAGAHGGGAMLCPSVMMMATSSLYRVPHAKFRADFVYTNNTYCQAMRGYGNPQVTFAIESQMDVLAEKAGIDPVEFRLLNVNMPGDVTPQNFHIPTCGLKECIQEVAKRLGRQDQRKVGGERNRGLGIASLIHVGGGARIFKSDGCGTIIRVDDFGTVNVFTGATDVGQGAETVIAQIVSEEIGVLPEDVNVIDTDTDVCPWDVGVHASRTTFVAGNSALMAAKKVKEQILDIAAGFADQWKDEEGNTQQIKLDENPANLAIKDRMVYSIQEPDKRIDLGKILRRAHYRKGGTMITAECFYDPPNELYDGDNKGDISATYAFGAHGVVVEVDRETGKVRVLKYVAAHDVGQAINPMLLEGQIYGGVVMGTGYAMTEQLIMEKGKTMNANLRDYKLLTAKDVIPIEPVIVETIDPGGPYGAKGIGEPGCVPSAPAIANAIYNAVGVRIKSLPITPERILAALRRGKEESI